MSPSNTPPSNHLAFILEQIQHLATHIAQERKARGQTQLQWAKTLGISQSTMARIEHGDPTVATATYLSCLWLINPHLNILSLVQPLKTNVSQIASDNESVETSHTSSAVGEFAQLLMQWKTSVYNPTVL